jgi:dolichol-phosphate mannosyltransferase
MRKKFMANVASRWLTALPVFNESRHVCGVLDEVRRYSDHVLVVDDGSTDGTAGLLQRRDDIQLVRHAENRGYGAALKTAFDYAAGHHYDGVVTIDCDGQHEPQRIPRFVEACADVDIVSGSRYLRKFDTDTAPPEQRRWINQQITAKLNRCLGWHLTDAFCGFKAYRVAAVQSLALRETGYAMPLELWVQAAAADLRVVEFPVPLIYLEEERSFGGSLDDAQTRLQYYNDVLKRSMAAAGMDPCPDLNSLCGKGVE